MRARLGGAGRKTHGQQSLGNSSKCGLLNVVIIFVVSALLIPSLFLFLLLFVLYLLPFIDFTIILI